MLTPVPGTSATSGMTGQDVITAVRDLLNEAQPAFWTDAQLLKWINDGITDIVGKTWCIADSETITLLTDTVEYALANDTIATVSVVYNSEKGLVVGHPSMLGNHSRRTREGPGRLRIRLDGELLLELAQPPVGALGQSKQLPMGSVFDHPAFLDHEDAIRAPQRGEPVGNRKDRSTCDQPIQGLLYFLLGLGVNAACGLV